MIFIKFYSRKKHSFVGPVRPRKIGGLPGSMILPGWPARPGPPWVGPGGSFRALVHSPSVTKMLTYTVRHLCTSLWT